MKALDEIREAIARLPPRERSLLLAQLCVEDDETRDSQKVHAIDLVKHLEGTLRDGPSDVATDPKYLEGFGK
jgi:hypothetical protein